MRPDAIPVVARASLAVLPPGAVRGLFGQDQLWGTERVALVRLGETRAHVAVEGGSALALRLDGLDAAVAGPGLRLQGPVGAVDAPASTPVGSRLLAPGGVRGAWGLGDAAVFALGPVALHAAVETGDALALAVDRALWLGAGAPETARWLPQTSWADAEPEPDADPRLASVSRRVVTETDVRQARLRHQRIRLRPGQIVTPAARSLGREWDVFADPDPPRRP